MLSSISWAAFSKAALSLTLVYYLAIAIVFYPKEIKAWLRRRIKALTILAITLPFHRALRAQTADANNGINQANTLVRGYYDTAVQLMYAVGAIVAIIGAIRVYGIWVEGNHREAGKAAAAWFGACIFLVIVATVIKSFFGL